MFLSCESLNKNLFLKGPSLDEVGGSGGLALDCGLRKSDRHYRR